MPGFPSARIGDNHTCPLVNPGPVPHVGGPILPPCCPTVLTCNMPAARVTDLALCVGPPDTIIKGSATVLIGGLPAARLTDTTIHGGVIVGPCCVTVLIGDPAVIFPFEINGLPAFRAQVQAALATLYTTPTGKQLINGIAASGHTVTIVPTSAANGYCQAANGTNSQTAGVGTNSTISWNPNHNTVGPGDNPGSTVILGHEMVHAYHNANGTNANGPYDSYPGQNGASARGEERSTVGAGGTTINDPSGNPQTVPDYSRTSPTENSLRDDLGIPRRATYYPSNWPGGAPW
ncbi:MAG TPA: M91 family zinc metallopeptidase [Pyrinomonadaceae bacterium]